MNEDVRRVVRIALVGLALCLLLFAMPLLADLYGRAAEHGAGFGAAVLAIAGVIALGLGWAGYRLTAPSRAERLRRAPLDLSDLSEDTATDKAKQAIAKLEQDLARVDLTGVEKDVCRDELDVLDALRGRLERDEIRIALIGTVSAGKSSVVNALLGEDRARTAIRGGTTTEVAGHRWSIDLAKFGRVEVVDTPGLDEVDAAARADMAEEAARLADVVLFVIDSDLKAHEAEALDDLTRHGKPVLVVLNKADAYTAGQRGELVAVVRERVGPAIPADHVVCVNSAPAPREVVRVLADGTEASVEVQDPADVSELATALYALLASEGKSLVAINALVQADQVREAIRLKVADARNAEARKLIEAYAVISGATIALNPLPGVDLVADVALNGKLAYDLGVLRGHRLTTQSLALLLKEMGLALGAVGVVNAATKIAGSVLKTVPVVGTIGGGLLQGVVSGYTTYVLGLALDHYFKHNCSWGDDGARDVVRAAVRTADKLQVMRLVKDHIVRKLAARLGGGGGG